MLASAHSIIVSVPSLINVWTMLSNFSLSLMKVLSVENSGEVDKVHFMRRLLGIFLFCLRVA